MRQESFESWMKTAISEAEKHCDKYPGSAESFMGDMMSVLLGMQRGMFALVPYMDPARNELEALFNTYWDQAQATRVRIRQEIEQTKAGAA